LAYIGFVAAAWRNKDVYNIQRCFIRYDAATSAAAATDDG